MKKKFIVLLIAVVVLSTLLLSACGGDKETNYYDELEKSLVKSAAAYDKIEGYFALAMAYSYSVELYSEELTNFDFDKQMMPNDKPEGENERKKWSKPEVVYSFTRLNDDWYVKVEYTAPKLDAAGYPTYSDAKFKKPLYEQTVTGEYWLVAGVFTAKTNGNVVYSGAINGFDKGLAVCDEFDVNEPDIAKSFLSAFSDETAFDRAVFGTVNKNIFGKEVVTYQNYYVDTADGAVGYRDSDKAVGFNEDLRFSWSEILGAISQTVCLSAKKEKLVKLEMYSEYFASYNKTTTQVWDGKTVTNWYGDRIAATKAVIEFDYGSKKSPIAIPAL